MNILCWAFESPEYFIPKQIVLQEYAVVAG